MSNMSRGQRRLIFWIAFSLFLILSPLVVFYAMGYTYDTSSASFVRTGSLRFVTNTPVSITINDINLGSTSFFNTSFENSFGKSRVVPELLKIELKTKEGAKWSKSIELKPAQFIDFPKIVIPPSVLNEDHIATLSHSFNQMSFNDGFLYIYNKTDTKKAISKSREKVVRFDMRNVFLRSLISSESLDFNLSSISQASNSLVDFSGTLGAGTLKDSLKFRPFGGDARTAFYSGNRLYIVWPRQTGYQPFIEANTTSDPIIFDKKIEDVFWYKDGEHLFVLSDGKVYFIDIDFRGEIQRTIIKDNIDGPIYYIDYQNGIYIVNNKSKTLIRLDVDF